jgi:hypothetical protein
MNYKCKKISLFTVLLKSFPFSIYEIYSRDAMQLRDMMHQNVLKIVNLLNKRIWPKTVQIMEDFSSAASGRF